MKAMKPDLACLAALVTLSMGVAAPPAAPQVNGEATPYAGLLFTQREARLPASALLGASAVFQLEPSRMFQGGVQPFIGADVFLAAVESESEAGAGELHLDYYVAARAGFSIESPGRPRLFGLVGRALPRPEAEWDRETREWTGSQSNVFGGGFNISAIGMMVEVRVMRDQRWGLNGTSVALVVGYARTSSKRRKH